MEEEPFDSVMSGDKTDRVRELVVRRQHRVDGAPCQLAVADFTTSRAADTAGFTNGEWREVVVQHEGFLAGTFQLINELLVITGAEGGNHERLGLTAGEERGTVRTRQDTGLRLDLTNRAEGRDRPIREPVSMMRPRTTELSQLLEKLANNLGLRCVFCIGAESFNNLRLCGIQSIATARSWLQCRRQRSHQLQQYL